MAKAAKSAARSTRSPAAPPPDRPAARTVRVEVQHGDLTAIEAELVVVDAYEGVEQLGGVTAKVDAATGGALARVVRSGDFKGRFKESILVHPAQGNAKRVLLVGMGKIEKLSADRVRRVAAVVARRARDLGVESVHMALHGVRRDGSGVKPRVAAEAIAEGALLGLYQFTQYKGPKSDEEKEREAKHSKLARIVLVEKNAASARQAEEGAEVGAVIAQATNQCRDWANYASDDAAPARYGERAEALAEEHGLHATVLDKASIQEHGMGGLLAVASGSAREPRFVVLEHAPRSGAKGTIVLVGKGITFDSGGISIKPAEKMEDMKFDKCGASAVMAAVVAAKQLKLPLRVVAIAPFTDNLPSGTAYKPGDIVRTMSGKTIEIVNTDAEGRVILSDALHYGGRFEPDAMVELSTLTGACPVAVGHHAIAGMGNSDDLLAQLRAAGDAVNERVWPMPFFDEYGEMVKSKVADVRNSAGRIASTVTAGKFLENFVGDHPWVHLDIASTAYADGLQPKLNEEYCPEQATGVGVRLLVQWMRNYKRPAWKKKAAPKRK